MNDKFDFSSGEPENPTMNRDEAISRLRGIRCGFKSTSCPDQLARALELSKTKQ